MKKRKIILERQESLRSKQERLLQSQTLLNQREDLLFSRSQELRETEVNNKEHELLDFQVKLAGRESDERSNTWKESRSWNPVKCTGLEGEGCGGYVKCS
ncbi:unnamed protein product [Sphenostylis stenocarpa]|uniref:Uncharacterized protein n=1 Tax=Sphenostylis stenocarpa TaxID=92480 RepID=A0AA86RU03_9FABA|nr:unnamed protein product [Sphenostylis stenocarpa]